MTEESTSDAQDTESATAAALAPLRWLDHANGRLCPPCGERVDTEAITNLVYTFERCDCGTPDFTHLTEQLWHRGCFAEAEASR